MVGSGGYVFWDCGGRCVSGVTLMVEWCDLGTSLEAVLIRAIC